MCFVSVSTGSGVGVFNTFCGLWSVFCIFMKRSEAMEKRSLTLAVWESERVV